ncbi:MAG: Gfo/Idh/MocA family oxidoreductase [Planctomycetes bacterium]|nr:Gfo/Idh/MocA family oxidoreductase [Planctomycetota bacterium]
MKSKLNRRNFMRSTAAIGAGLFIAPQSFGAGAAAGAKDDINVALLGAGAEGQVLMNAILKLGKGSGIRFRAVCDIWEKQPLKRVSRTLNAYKAYGHAGTAYTEYKEMLDSETDLDAVIVATPDFWHAEHACACMEKGLHVYCEKEMSNTLEGAKKIVETARKTKRLVQIGHQRRSNPRYRHCYDKIINKADLIGRITTINGQWNRSKAACEDLGWPKGSDIDKATLEKYGFKDMKQFRNWRWYKGKGGGPIVDLGSHQIDIYAWFLGAQPKSIIASGGIDYWTDHEWYDNVIAIYEFETKKGPVRASYQTITTNSNGGYFEVFMGDEGTLEISEPSSRGAVYRESSVPEEKWEKWIKEGVIAKVEAPKPAAGDHSAGDVRSSVPATKYNIPVEMNVPFHQPHLVNFFDSIRGTAKLNCPVEIGYETAAMVLKANEAVEAGKKLDFKPSDFHV